MELDDTPRPSSLQALVRRERSDSGSSSSSNSSVVTVIYSPLGTSASSDSKTESPLAAKEDPIDRARTPTQQHTPIPVFQTSRPPGPRGHTRSTSQFSNPLQTIPSGVQVPTFNQRISSSPFSTPGQSRRRGYTSETQRLNDIDYVRDTVAQLRPRVEALERRGGIASTPEIFSPTAAILNQNRHRYRSVSEQTPRSVVLAQAGHIGRQVLSSFTPPSLSQNPPFQGQTNHSSVAIQLHYININRSSSEQFPAFEPISFEAQTPRSGVASNSSTHPPVPRSRRRSSAICGENPLEQPITAEEQAITNLVQHINRQNRQEDERQIRQRSVSQTQVNNSQSLQEIKRAQRRADLLRSGGYRGTVLTRSPTQRRVSSANTSQASNVAGSTSTSPKRSPFSDKDSDSASQSLQSSGRASL